MAVPDTRQASVRASLTTPLGGGGIAVIVVRGERALRVVDAVFRPKNRNEWLAAAPDSLHYGHVVDDSEVVDEVIVRIALSQGRRETVEVNCHGGVVAAAEVMRLLTKAGAVETPPWDVVDSRLDRIQADALRLLPSASTRLAVRVLCDQVNGALSEAIRDVDHVHALASERLDALIESASFGTALTRPRRIALIGSPNVGKSALFNALVGHDRAIVSPTPGTTRDFVDELLVLSGYPIELIDTAGLRQRGGVVEMKGVAATWRVVSSADLLIFVVDRSVGICARERALIEQLMQRDTLLVANKCDLPARPGWRPPRTDWCEVSARTGDGLPNLRRAILRRFPDAASYPPGTPVVFTIEQAQALARAKELAGSGRLADAQRELVNLLRRPSSAAQGEGRPTSRDEV